MVLWHGKESNIKRISLHIAVFLLVVFSVGFSQSVVKIQGKVVDVSNGEPLNGVNISVESSAFGAASDETGYFEIDNLLTGSYTITARHIGYKPQTREIRVQHDQPAKVTFQLQPRILTMPAVKVTAEADKNQSADVVITAQEIKDSRAEHVGQVLQHLGGIHVQSQGGTGSQQTISIRGSQSNQVVVVLDGVQLNDELTGQVDLAQVPLHNVKRIEIHKGSASAEYGSGAIGGVIHIFTGRQSEDRLTVRSTLGPYQYFRTEPSLSGHWRGLNFTASYQHMQTQNDYPFSYKKPDGKVMHEQRINSDCRSDNLFFQLKYGLDAHQFSLKWQNYQANRGLPGKVHSLTAHARSELSRHLFNASYCYNSTAWRLCAHLDAGYHQTDDKNLWPKDAELRFRLNPQYRVVNKLQKTSGRFQAQFNAAEWWTIHSGLESKLIDYRDENRLVPGNKTIGTAEDFSRAFYLKQKFRLHHSWFSIRMTPALRYDLATLASEQNIRHEQQWSPSLAAFLSAGSIDQFVLKSSIGRGFRIPTFADLFYQDFRVQGKPDLLPEKSVNSEIGIGWQHRNHWKWKVNATYFHNNVDDMIVWRLGSFEVFRPFNTDVTLLGQEWDVSVKTPQQRISLQTSYTHLQTFNKNPNITLHNNQLPYRPEHAWKTSLLFNLGSWHAEVKYRNISSRFINQANTKKMPAYDVLDCRLHYKFNYRKLKGKLSIAILNALNEKYQIIRNMPLPPREWRIGMNFSY